MKHIITAAALALTAVAASAGPTCTAPKDSWKPEAQFQQELKDQGVLRQDDTTVRKGRGIVAQYSVVPSLVFSEQDAGRQLAHPAHKIGVEVGLKNAGDA